MLIYCLFLRVARVEECQEFVNPQTSLRDRSKRFFFFKSNHSYSIIGLHVSTWSLSAAWQVLRMWNSQRDEKEARECDWLRLDVIWGIKLVAFYYFLFFWRVCDDEQDKKKAGTGKPISWRWDRSWLFFLWQVDPHFKNMHTRLCYVDSLCVSFSTSKAASTEYILYSLISCLVTESSMNEAE